MKKRRWTEAEREIVRRDYRGTNASAQEIASRLGVTFTAVKGQVQRMGISFRPDMKVWTLKEEERLAELITQYAPYIIARKMNRTVHSVTTKSKRLGCCSRRVRDGWYTKKEVCEILGVDHRWVQARIDSGELKASWHFDIRPQQSGGRCWHIPEESLRDFIVEHSVELTGRNVDLWAIVSILRE